MRHLMIQMPHFLCEILRGATRAHKIRKNTWCVILDLNCRLNIQPNPIGIKESSFCFVVNHLKVWVFFHFFTNLLLFLKGYQINYRFQPMNYLNSFCRKVCPHNWLILGCFQHCPIGKQQHRGQQQPIWRV